MVSKPTRVDVHQHLWSAPLIDALARRSQRPFVRREHGLTVLYLAGERPYVLDLSEEEPARRASLVERDGLDRALLCLSSPLGAEWLPRAQALELIEAYHEGALAGGLFGVWGAVPLAEPDPHDVDATLERGCIGISLPAGALAGADRLARMRPLLERLEARDAPLLVHPGPGGPPPSASWPDPGLEQPLWWPALTSYVAGMSEAWLAFMSSGRPRHPRLRIVFTMLAGLAPLQFERLKARGGPAPGLRDPLVFYDTSSYGPVALHAVKGIVGEEQVLYGSDRPVVQPEQHGMLAALDWDSAGDGARRALAQVGSA